MGLADHFKRSSGKSFDLAKLYKPDHKVGMEVPEGGSNCDKCRHLSGPQQCDDDEFIQWNGSGTIPVKTSKYCCDFFATSTRK